MKNEKRNSNKNRVGKKELGDWSERSTRQPVNQSMKRQGSRENNHNGYTYDNKKRQKNDKSIKNSEGYSVSKCKREMVKILNDELKDDEIKLYALSSLYVGMQMEDLTRVLKKIAKSMEDG